jgi:cold shock CspA family protein
MDGTVCKLVHTHRFGLIRSQDGREIFFHRSSLLGLDFDRLREGQEVEFEEKRDENGPRAILVRPRRD